MKLYISGPISNYPNKNERAFQDMARAVNLLGHHAVTPFNLNTVEPQSAKDWVSNMKRDIKYLPSFDGLVLIKGWELSLGSKIEVALAHFLNIPIYRYSYGTLVIVDIAVDLEVTSLIPSDLFN